MNGLLTSARYSLAPNQLGHCGPQGAYKELQKFIEAPNPESAAAAERLLKQFTASYAYLRLIADANSLEPFDEQAVEAYWIGNELLENVPHSAMQEMIMQEFSAAAAGAASATGAAAATGAATSTGADAAAGIAATAGRLPERIARAKAESLPKGVRPHHSMHVLHINFLNPSLEPLLKNLTECLVLWAEVKKPTKKGLQVKTAHILRTAGRLSIGEHVRVVDACFVPDAQPKEFLSIHWGKAIERIDSDQLKNLKNYTVRNLEALGLSGKYS